MKNYFPHEKLDMAKFFDSLSGTYVELRDLNDPHGAKARARQDAIDKSKNTQQRPPLGHGTTYTTSGSAKKVADALDGSNGDLFSGG